MKINQELAFALIIAGLVCTACKKEELTPAPPPPVASKTPPVEAPKPEPTIPAELVILTPQQAKDHVGDEAIVRGKVFGVHVTAKGDVFINVGAAYPNAPFIAVCFQGAIPADDLKKLNGKTVSFKGTIKEHSGQPEIILNSADQISE